MGKIIVKQRGANESSREYVERHLPGQFVRITDLCGEYGLTFEQCVGVIVSFYNATLTQKEIKIGKGKFVTIIRESGYEKKLKANREYMRRIRAKAALRKKQNGFYKIKD